MKKRAGIIFFAGLLLLCPAAAGCKKENKAPEAPVQDAWTVCDTENVRGYTLDEDGNLYTFEYIIPGEGPGRDAELRLNKYDVNGDRVFSRLFEEIQGGYMEAMAVKDGSLYFAPEVSGDDGSRCSVLYSYDLETGEFARLKAFPSFRVVKRILAGEDRLWLLGTGVTGSGGGRLDEYHYSGERVAYCTIPDGETGELAVPEPVDIALDETGKLLLYTHTEEGFVFSRYDVRQDAVKEMARTEEYRISRIAVCNQGEDILYRSHPRGLVMSSLSALDVESELHPEMSMWDDKGPCCVGGRAACMLADGRMVQFKVDEVKKEAPVIRYMTLGNEMAAPYGCGYEMRQINFDETAADKFALKIMALDKDFDLCLVDTSYSFSHNLKKNAMFYPLNDVPGVREYLDACFPYVGEAATGKDGTIWMLPVAVNIPGLVVSGAEMEKGQTLVKDNMTYGEYFSALAAMDAGERRRVSTPWGLLLSEFFWQYFSENTSADTPQFKDTLRLFAEYWKYLTEEKAGTEEGGYEHVRAAMDYRALYITMLGENARVYDVPKAAPDGENTGTCLFLAVNPHSDNLETVLGYISAWCAYMVNRSDTPLFFAGRVPDGTVYEISLYKLYQDGKIGFAMDADVLEGYGDVLEDVTKLEAYVKETERKLRIYFGE